MNYTGCQEKMEPIQISGERIENSENAETCVKYNWGETFFVYYFSIFFFFHFQGRPWKWKKPLKFQMEWPILWYIFGKLIKLKVHRHKFEICTQNRAGDTGGLVKQLVEADASWTFFTRYFLIFITFRDNFFSSWHTVQF